MYRPKNGEPEVQCALKYLKPAEELPNQKVWSVLYQMALWRFQEFVA